MHPMSTVTIAVDSAKNVFEITVAGRAGAIRERNSYHVLNSSSSGDASRVPCRNGSLIEFTLLGALPDCARL
jgi:hypothetical protein